MTVCHHEILKLLATDIVYIAREFLTLKYGPERNAKEREKEREKEKRKINGGNDKVFHLIPDN
jgi:hypothetical protein